MKNSHTHLPSLKALKALLLLSETGSISKTAEQLHVTHGAVSHMIKTLEENLNVSLTTRSGRQVILTGQGQQYVDKIAPALGEITQAARSLNAASGPVVLNVASGFAANWLSHHVSEFRQQFPDINLSFKTPRAYGHFDGYEDDLYVTFARPDDVPNTAHLLLKVVFFPVCSPKLLSNHATPADLLKHDLLHLDGRADWQKWLETSDIATPQALPHLSGILFDDMQSMLAATIAAQGICLGDQLTCAHALSEGQLQRPFSHSVQTDRAYYILEGKRGLSPAAKALKDWLIKQFL